jgi:hypothetical protein
LVSLESVNRFAAAVLIGLLATPAQADARSEAALQDYLNAIDAGLAWSASAGNIRSEGRTTIAEDIAVSRTNPAIAVTFDVIRFDDLAIGSDGTLTASAIGALAAAISTEKMSVTLPDLNATKVIIPNFGSLKIEPDKFVSGIGRLYTALAKVEAERIDASAVNVVQNFPLPGESELIRSETVYRDFIVENYRDGVIATMGWGETIITQTTPDGPMRMKIGVAKAEAIDIGQMARVLDPDAYIDGRGDGIWKPVTDRIEYSDFEVRPPDGSIIGIARIAANDMAMRQPERRFTEDLDWLFSHPDADEDDIKQRVLSFLPQVIRSMRFGEFGIEGMAIKPAAPDNGKAIIGQIRVAGFSADGIDEVSLDGIRATAPEATFNLDRFAITGIGFSDFDNLAAMIDLSERDDDPAVKSEIVRRMFGALPVFDGMMISGFSVAAAGKPLIRIGNYDFAVTGRIHRFPIAGTIRMRDLVMTSDVWRETATPFAEALDAFGYAEIAVDADGKTSWTAATGLLDAVIEYRARNIGDIRLNYGVTGLTESWLDTVFEMVPALEGNDNPMAGMALLNPLGFKNALLEITDRSIVDRALAYYAAKQDLDTETYRTQLKGALPFMLGMLGDPDLQNKTAAALLAFLDGGHRLTISLDPEDIVLLPSLVGTAAMSPKALVELLGGDISASPVN